MTARLTPRRRRALAALLEGSLTREQLDRVVGCSNSPALVSELRGKLGLSVVCTMEKVIDRDGQKIERGRYCLTGPDAQAARAMLADEAGA